SLSESANCQNTRKKRRRRSKQVYSPVNSPKTIASQKNVVKSKKIISDSDSSSDESAQGHFDAEHLTPVFEAGQLSINSRDSLLPEKRITEPLSSQNQDNTPKDKTSFVPVRINNTNNWNNQDSLIIPDKPSGLDDQEQVGILTSGSESESAHSSHSPDPVGAEGRETLEPRGQKYAHEKQRIQSLDQYFREFRRFEATILGELHSIKTDVEIIRAETLQKGRSNTINCPITIPCTTENELKCIEEQLKGSNCREKLIQWCATIGGHTYKSHTKRILCKVIDQGLSEKINFTGRGSKIQYKNLRLNAVVIAAVTSKQDCTAADVEKESMNFFRFARDRNGGRARRVKI
ncbi:unnamed protein product, partial [Allacma fusca]